MNVQDIVDHIDALLAELRDDRAQLEHARGVLVAREEPPSRPVAPVSGVAKRVRVAERRATATRDSPRHGTPAVRATLPVDRRVMVALIERTPGISTAEIAERLSYDPAAVRRILMRMQEQGEVASTVTGTRQLWSILSEDVRYAKRMAELEAALTARRDTARRGEDAGAGGEDGNAPALTLVDS